MAITQTVISATSQVPKIKSIMISGIDGIRPRTPVVLGLHLSRNKRNVKDSAEIFI